jgi:hypothetical protein
LIFDIAFIFQVRETCGGRRSNSMTDDDLLPIHTNAEPSSHSRPRYFVVQLDTAKRTGNGTTITTTTTTATTATAAATASMAAAGIHRMQIRITSSSLL